MEVKHFAEIEEELQLTPWRIALVTFPAPSHDEGQRIWRAQEGGQ